MDNNAVKHENNDQLDLPLDVQREAEESLHDDRKVDDVQIQLGILQSEKADWELKHRSALAANERLQRQIKSIEAEKDRLLKCVMSLIDMLGNHDSKYDHY